MILPYIEIVIMICLSALFSGSEIAFSSSSEIKLRKRSEEGKKSAGLAHWIFDNYDKALVTILIGNNLVNIGASSLATVIAISLMGDKGVWLATMVMTVLIIIFGEISPKVIASKRPEKIACLVAYPIRALMWVTAPIVLVMKGFLKELAKFWKSSAVDDTVTEEDLETIIDTAEDEGVVDEDTADLLQSALDFDDVYAYEIITHRMDMYAIDIDDDEQHIKNALIRTHFSRVPVYRENTDHIIGFIFVTQALKAMAAGEFDIRKLLLKPVFVHKTMPLDDVLNTMRRKKCHMVIVTDEYGGTMGLITMEDVLEQLVGEIWDEKDVIDEEFEEIDEGIYDADGDMRIDDLFEELEIEDEEFESDNATLGGWATEMLGGYPRSGDSFEFAGYTFIVAEARNMRVYSMQIRRLPAPEDDKTDE